jgi:hypothetical protein
MHIDGSMFQYLAKVLIALATAIPGGPLIAQLLTSAEFKETFLNHSFCAKVVISFH